MNTVHAVFLISFRNGKVVATTRPDNPDQFGLVGGKVDEGETAKQALLREAFEEGVKVVSPLFFVRQSTVNGKTVQWFYAEKVESLDTFKEENRLSVVETSIENISQFFGNYFLRYMFN